MRWPSDEPRPVDQSTNSTSPNGDEPTSRIVHFDATIRRREAMRQKAATPTPDNILAPSGDKTPPIPIETPPGTLPTPSPTESPTDVPTIAPTETATPTATPIIVGPPPALFIREFLANPAAVGDSEGEQ